ncbi:MAG: hypothetical protein MUO87_00025 [Thermoplasmata archaeon]|nr:hypothetical protein [Thermoplasmata archaeon]
MNERDLKLAEEVGSHIQPNGSPAVYILTTKYTNLVRTNLVLLKAFLDMKTTRGMMITIDRPHQYISHLLQLHGIDQARLVFIDAISNHASDTKAAPNAEAFQSGPFYIETLPDFIISCDGRDPESKVDMSNTEFILMDNVSTLLTYNSMENVKTFFSRYVGVLKERSSASLATLIVMDRDLHADLYSFISPFARKIIEISTDMKVGNVVEPKYPTGQQSRPSANGLAASDRSEPGLQTKESTGEM